MNEIFIKLLAHGPLRLVGCDLSLCCGKVKQRRDGLGCEWLSLYSEASQNLAIAESFTPLADEERLAFSRDILSSVRPDKT